MKEYSAMASICDGELKCACAKEACMTCECREHFKCIDAKVIVNDEPAETPKIIRLLNNEKRNQVKK